MNIDLRALRRRIFKVSFGRLFILVNGRATFADLATLQMASFFFFGGMLFDSIKAALFPGWRPLVELGLPLYLIYFCCNLAVPLSVILIKPGRFTYPTAGVLLCLCVFLSGFLNWLILILPATISERALIPLVFHGMFGFLAGVLLALRLEIRKIRFQWNKAAPRDEASIIAYRTGFEHDLNVLLGAAIGTAAASVLGVGIAMIILVIGKRGWVPTDPDFNATMMQFSVGLGVSLGCIYRWGVAEIIRIKSWMKGRIQVQLSRRSTPAEPSIAVVIANEIRPSGDFNMHQIVERRGIDSK